VYDKNLELFGRPGSQLRGRVKSRRVYLEKLRVSSPERFLDLIRYHNLAPPASLPTVAVEFATSDLESTSSENMSANRNLPRNRRGDGEIS
jgi:hypothetical protein